MKCLITGGAGYIGSVLTEHVLLAGHSVTVFDNFTYDQPSISHLVHNKNLKVVVDDVRNESALVSEVRKADAIFHMAALVGAPLVAKKPKAAHDINIISVQSLSKNLSKNQILFYPSSNSVYGSVPDGILCDEDTTTNALSQYALEKLEAERILSDHQSFICFRLATVFGMSSRMRIDLLVNDFVNRALRDGAVLVFEGTAKRNHVYVRDAAAAITAVLERPDDFSREIFNLGLSNANYSKIEICERIAKQTTFHYAQAEFSADVDKRDYSVSNKKIENLGITCETSIEEGIRELLVGLSTLKYRNFVNVQ